MMVRQSFEESLHGLPGVATSGPACARIPCTDPVHGAVRLANMPLEQVEQIVGTMARKECVALRALEAVPPEIATAAEPVAAIHGQGGRGF